MLAAGPGSLIQFSSALFDTMTSHAGQQANEQALRCKNRLLNLTAANLWLSIMASNPSRVHGANALSEACRWAS